MELLAINTTWAPWLILLAAFAAWEISYRIHYSLGLLYFISLFRSLEFGVEGSLILTLTAFFFCRLHPKHELKVVSALYAVCMMSIMITLGQFVLPFHERKGLSGNGSMNGCLIALLLPFALRRMKDFFSQAAICGLAVLAVFGTLTSIPVGVLALIFLTGGHFYGWGFWGLLAGSCCIFGLGFSLSGGQFISSSGRFEGWQTILDWWKASDHYWLGLGTGAGTTIFGRQHFADPNFAQMGLWAHNDFLQILFDNGVIGLVVFILCFIYVLYHSYDRPTLFAANVGYSATAFYNFPLHVPLHALVGASLVWLTYRGKQYV